MASDEVTDLIALIEMYRQEAQKEAGLAAACSEALHKLHELLEREKAAMQLQGPDNGHPANIEAVMHHIQRVKKLAAGQDHRNPKRARFGQQRPPWSAGARNPARSKGRRAMGRRGAR